MNLKRISFILLFILGLTIFSPVMAQDDELEIVPTEEVVDAPLDEALEEVPVADEAIDWNQYLSTGLLGLILVVLIFNAYQAWNTGGDSAVAEEITGWQENRELVAPAETWYQGRSEGFKIAFDNLGEFMQFLGQMTNLQTPESISNLMKDIAEPGKPIPSVVTQRVLAEFAAKSKIEDEDHG